MKCPVCGSELAELTIQTMIYDVKGMKVLPEQIMEPLYSKGYFCVKCNIMIQITKLPRK